MTGEEIADQPGAADALKSATVTALPAPFVSAAQAARKLPLGGLFVLRLLNRLQ